MQTNQQNKRNRVSSWPSQTLYWVLYKWRDSLSCHEAVYVQNHYFHFAAVETKAYQLLHVLKFLG